LVQRAKTGCNEAWRDIYDAYHVMLVAKVQAKVRACSRGRFEAEDILQTAFIKAWKHIEGFEYQGEGSFRSWLACIVVNAFKTELQKHQNEPLEPSGSPSQVEAEQFRTELRRLDWEQSRADTLEALGRLSDEDQDVLIQRVFEHRSFETIAESLGVSRDTARKAFTAALLRLGRQVRS
jgi:RNA polymerase sigma-70 factor (ECF subfamily)